jgi:4-carboxymuconolactone decarboxylase
MSSAVAAARRAGWPRAALEETALMLTLYAGYPAAIEALRVLAARWPARASAGEIPAATRRARGTRLLDGVYGPVRPALVRELDRLHPALASWVVDHGYGRVLARPRLDPATRELITVALLAGTPWTRQLASHRIGARRLGADPRWLAAATRGTPAARDGAGRRGRSRG